MYIGMSVFVYIIYYTYILLLERALQIVGTRGNSRVFTRKKNHILNEYIIGARTMNIIL